MSNQKMSVVALVSTYKREELLIKRCIKSIVNQVVLPSAIIIVDDGDNEQPLSAKTRDKLIELVPSNISLIILPNSRDKGLAGALNTGLVYATKLYDKDNTYIAILDDDDEWKSDHLSTCIHNCNNDDVVVSGLIRVEKGKYINNELFGYLGERDFYVKNPGIQGSNFFVRLSIILQAGMFDEHLESTTDRDIFIRIFELEPKVSYPQKHTVLHYADDNRVRLSTRSSKKKLSGVQSFWDKYRTRMSDSEKEDFLSRSSSVFGFKPIKRISKTEQKLKKTGADSFQLVVGVISDSLEQFKPLFDSLMELSRSHVIESLELLILDNATTDVTFLPLENAVISGSGCFSYTVINQNQQQQDAANSVFGFPYTREIGKTVSIAKGRTMLQKYIAQFVKDSPNKIVWVLDDDMQIHYKVYDYLMWLPKFKQAGVDVLIGSYEGGSPNPSLNAIRVQLVDLYNNLRWVDNLNDGEELENRSAENNELRNKYSDYYYDLSRKHYGHLEQVSWQYPRNTAASVSEIKRDLEKSAMKILTGEPFFRPLVSDVPEDPINEAVDSANRGGNTFIFNHEVLNTTPNVSIEIENRDCRRSDMIWGLINRHYFDYNIKMVNFPIYHSRNSGYDVDFNMSKSIDEIVGASIYSALSECLLIFPKRKFKFTEEELTILCEKVYEYLDSRLALYELNFSRVEGLIKLLDRFDKEGHLKMFLESISKWIDSNNYEKLSNVRNSINRNHLKHFLSNLHKEVECYSKGIEVNNLV